MKTLYVLIQDGGDGSSYPHYTFDEAFIERLRQKDNAGELEHGDLGVDGDGFHYGTLTVPDECTLSSLSIIFDAATDYEDDDDDYEDDDDD